MLYECAIVALIFGSTPLINQYILKHIEVESFISILSVFYFGMVLLYVALTNRTDLYLDIGTLNDNMHLYPLIAVQLSLLNPTKLTHSLVYYRNELQQSDFRRVVGILFNVGVRTHPTNFF